MNRRIGKAAVLVIIGVVVGATAALATPPSGLTSVLLARGPWISHQDFRMFVGAVSEQQPPEVAMVQATLAPGGTTGWHQHSGPSVVILKSGTLRISEPGPDGRCRISRVTADDGADAFFHTTQVHKFDNPSTGANAEFFIAYFVPSGPILIDAPAPAGCP